MYRNRRFRRVACSDPSSKRPGRYPRHPEEGKVNIEAIIRPGKLVSVRDALADVGLVGINVAHVIGRGAQKGIAAPGPRGVGTYLVDMLPKVKLELVVREEDADRATGIIIRTARTGNIGDGKFS